MKKCLHCESLCDDNVTICPKCGAIIDSYVNHKGYMDIYHNNVCKKQNNLMNIVLWFLLGLVLPYIGFIVGWIIYEGEKAKFKALIFGVIISTIIATFLPYILYLFNDKKADFKNDNGQQIKNLINIYKGL